MFLQRCVVPVTGCGRFASNGTRADVTSNWERRDVAALAPTHLIVHGHHTASRYMAHLKTWPEKTHGTCRVRHTRAEELRVVAVANHNQTSDYACTTHTMLLPNSTHRTCVMAQAEALNNNMRKQHTHGCSLLLLLPCALRLSGGQLLLHLLLLVMQLMWPLLQQTVAVLLPQYNCCS